MQDDYAYIADIDDGLEIVDITNPSKTASSTLIGTVDPDPSGENDSVFVAGNYAYLSGTNGIQIVDISDASSPYLVSTTSSPEGASSEDVFVSGKYAYLADQAGALSIMDISDPTNIFYGKYYYPK